MVSKVQTFEEWVVCNEEFSADPFIAARQAWQAAHENAARVCEHKSVMWEGDRSEMAGNMSMGAECCADAIREAAK